MNLVQPLMASAKLCSLFYPEASGRPLAGSRDAEMLVCPTALLSAGRQGADEVTGDQDFLPLHR